MDTQVYLHTGLFNTLLVLIILYRVKDDADKFKDSRLFSYLLLAVLIVNTFDTLGWVLDGQLKGSLTLITKIVDGIDLLATAFVAWSWTQYSQYLSFEDAGRPDHTNRFSTIILLVHASIVLYSIPTGFLFTINEAGVYARTDNYIIVVLLSILQLFYSICLCLYTRRKITDPEKRKELLLAAFIITIPIWGTALQSMYYGNTSIWTSMIIVILVIYIHIQDKRRGRETREQQNQLQQALKESQLANRAKTEFLSNMSHDIRTPMNAILGFTGIAKEHIEDKALVQESLGKIQGAGDHLLSLINDVLDMSRIESGRMQVQLRASNLEAGRRSIINMVRDQAAAKDIEIIEETQDLRDPYVYADKQKLNQIIINLVGNAIKFNRPGGKIILGIRQLESSRPGWGYYELTVKDTGMGIAPEYIQNIFEPFERGVQDEARDSIEGTGLGLAIVKRLVEMLGGTITLTSQLEQGSTFTIRLLMEIMPKATIEEALEAKRKKAARAGQQEAKGEATYAVLQGKRVLLAEDHPLNRQIAMRLLKDKGMEVEAAVDGRAAVAWFTEAPEGYYSLILMDIRMPYLNGYQATRAIRSLDRADAKTIPIIAMTANAFAEDKKMALEAGMNQHLAKPINTKEMFTLLTNILRDNSK